MQPDWMARAHCRSPMCQARPDDFYPAKGDTRVKQERARAACRMCPVITECLEYALATRPSQDFGVWGGTSDAQREKMRRKRRKQERIMDREAS